MHFILFTGVFYAYLLYKFIGSDKTFDSFKNATYLTFDKYFKIKGQLPYPDRPHIIILNHHRGSFLDTLSACAILPSTKFKFVSYINRVCIARYFLNKNKYIYFDENDPNRYNSILQQATNAVADGYSIVIYPEGERSRYYTSDNRHTLRKFHTGAVRLATDLKLPILSIATSPARSKYKYFLTPGDFTFVAQYYPDLSNINTELLQIDMQQNMQQNINATASLT